MMSDEPFVSIEHLAKRYHLGGRRGIVPVPSVLGFTVRPAGNQRIRDEVEDLDDDDFDGDEDEDQLDRGDRQAPSRDLWALRDVSAELSAGDTLGLIGPNGAGKSTLLKILANITPPTSGRAVMQGRVAPMLELATAFMHPELTGPANVRLLARLFEASTATADERMDEIMAFAELDGQESMPLKRYSGGMQRRLAFSIGLNLQPDILLADETIGVGDDTFRARCLARVQQSAREGMIVVFASHELDLIRRVCARVAWMDAGRVVAIGPTEEVVGAYERSFGMVDQPTDLHHQPGDETNILAPVMTIRVTLPDGEPVDRLRADQEASVELEVLARRNFELETMVIVHEAGGLRQLIAGGRLTTVQRGPRTTIPLASLQGADLDPGRYVVWVRLRLRGSGQDVTVHRVTVLDVEGSQEHTQETNRAAEPLRRNMT
jgi:ABC-type polysaccharide/polyol phosphate transport system ATPase subunit